LEKRAHTDAADSGNLWLFDFLGWWQSLSERIWGIHHQQIISAKPRVVHPRKLCFVIAVIVCQLQIELRSKFTYAHVIFATPNFNC